MSLPLGQCLCQGLPLDRVEDDRCRDFNALISVPSGTGLGPIAIRLPTPQPPGRPDVYVPTDPPGQVVRGSVPAVMTSPLSSLFALQETTIEELKQQFLKQQDARGFVVDGFPREIGQAFTFEEQVGRG